MKAVLLAGGLGTRISEESHLRPKPMIEIGGRPILWHIMKIYSHHGINDFIVCCGYKGYLIKEYFANYFLHRADVRIDVTNNTIETLEQKSEPWRITLVDTGEFTQTGGRLARVRQYLDPGETFCMTYGDGVTDLDVTDLVASHQKREKLATLTAVRPAARFGALALDQAGNVIEFREKPVQAEDYINGGFFVLNEKVLDLIDGDDCIWEREPLESLAFEGNLAAYRHEGFWQPMDTLREKNKLEDLWAKGIAPWRVWA